MVIIDRLWSILKSRCIFIKSLLSDYIQYYCDSFLKSKSPPPPACSLFKDQLKLLIL